MSNRNTTSLRSRRPRGKALALLLTLGGLCGLFFSLLLVVTGVLFGGTGSPTRDTTNSGQIFEALGLDHIWIAAPVGAVLMALALWAWIRASRLACAIAALAFGGCALLFALEGGIGELLGMHFFSPVIPALCFAVAAAVTRRAPKPNAGMPSVHER